MNHPSPVLFTFLQLNKFEIKIFLKEKKSDIGWDQFLLRKRIGTILRRKKIFFKSKKCLSSCKSLFWFRYFQFSQFLQMWSTDEIWQCHRKTDRSRITRIINKMTNIRDLLWKKLKKVKQLNFFFKLSRLVNKRLEIQDDRWYEMFQNDLRKIRITVHCTHISIGGLESW